MRRRAAGGGGDPRGRGLCLTALCSPGNLYSRLVHLEGDHVAVQIQDTPGCIQVRRCFGSIGSPLSPKGSAFEPQLPTRPDLSLLRQSSGFPLDLFNGAIYDTGFILSRPDAKFVLSVVPQAQEDCVQVLDSLSRCVKWAEGFLLVYSITDYSSYQSVRPLYQHIRKVHPDARTPVIIVGNKADLLHARQVQAKEGLQLANELGSLFLEISTSDDSQGVCDVFQYLCKEVSKLQHTGSTDRRRSSIIPRPKSPNMQDLKRRFKQALSSKVK